MAVKSSAVTKVGREYVISSADRASRITAATVLKTRVRRVLGVNLSLETEFLVQTFDRILNNGSGTRRPHQKWF